MSCLSRADRFVCRLRSFKSSPPKSLESLCSLAPKVCWEERPRFKGFPANGRPWSTTSTEWRSASGNLYLTFACLTIRTCSRNLTDQVRSIARVTTAVANGDLTSFVEVEARGEIGQLKVTINSMVTLLQTFVSEMSRVTNEVRPNAETGPGPPSALKFFAQVGTQGKLGGSVNVANAKGEWSKIVKGLNRMVDRVTKQVCTCSWAPWSSANAQRNEGTRNRPLYDCGIPRRPFATRRDRCGRRDPSAVRSFTRLCGRWPH